MRKTQPYVINLHFAGYAHPHIAVLSLSDTLRGSQEASLTEPPRFVSILDHPRPGLERASSAGGEQG